MTHEATNDGGAPLATGSVLRQYISETAESTDSVSAFNNRMGKLLADRLGDTPEHGASPMDYVQATALLQHDAQTGIDGRTQEPMPREVTGQPPLMYTFFEGEARKFARGAFGDTFADDVQKVYADLNEQRKATVNAKFNTVAERAIANIVKTPDETVEVIDEAFGFDAADAINVPVHVGLHKERDDETDEETGYYVLRADGYKNGKTELDEDMFGVRSRDPEQLRQIVAERVVPLYEAALDSLKGIVDGTNESMYDWRSPSEQPWKNPTEQPQAPNPGPEAS